MRGAVLAGGAASRYGGVPKGLLAVGGRRILDRVVESVQAVTGALPLLIANAPGASAWRLDLQTIPDARPRSEEHTSELQSLAYLVCRLLLEKKKYMSMS